MVETFEAREKKIGSITIKKNPNFPSGTSLQAYIKTNRGELRKVFGNPNMGESGDGKSKGKEWNLIVGPHRVTIYDRREMDKKGTKYFNIGGDGKYGALLVAQALSIHRNEKVHAIEISPAWDKEKFDYARGMKFPDSHDILTYERAKEYEDNRRRYRAESINDLMDLKVGQEIKINGLMREGEIPSQTKLRHHREWDSDGEYFPEYHQGYVDVPIADDGSISTDSQNAIYYAVKYWMHPEYGDATDGYFFQFKARPMDEADGLWKGKPAYRPIQIRWGQLRWDKDQDRFFIDGLSDELDADGGYITSKSDEFFHEDGDTLEARAYNERGIYSITPLEKKSAEEEDLTFKEWADQEMKTHGGRESFDDWLDDELESHGDNVSLQDWGHHELDSHYERYGAEYMNWGGDPKGQLATALRNARIKAKQPKKPLKIEKLDAETSGQWEIGEQLEEAQMNAETSMKMFMVKEYPHTITKEQHDEIIKLLDEHDPNANIFYVRYGDTMRIMSPHGPLKASYLPTYSAESDQFPSMHYGDYDSDAQEKYQEFLDEWDGDDDPPSFEEWEKQLEEYERLLQEYEGTGEYERAMQEQLEEAQMNAEDQNTDLLKWIEDYLWDNDKKGYQAYHAHRKSLGLSAEGKKRKKRSGVLSDPFDELSLDSGDWKGIVVGFGIGLLGLFGYSKLRK